MEACRAQAPRGARPQGPAPGDLRLKGGCTADLSHVPVLQSPKLSQVVSAGALDFAGPAQFITANGPLGSPGLSCWRLSASSRPPYCRVPAFLPAGQQDACRPGQPTVLARSWLGAADRVV